MMTLSFLYAQFFKKVVRGKCVYNSKVEKTAKIYSVTHFYDSSLGRHSYIAYDCEINNCQIGSFCSIANNTNIGGPNHPLEWVSTSPVFCANGGGPKCHLGNLPEPIIAPTIVGHDVWIGARAIVMQGITIGTGAVVGAGAVVTKDVPPYAIVAGCPAKIIRFRFDEDTISRLLESKWWELSDEELANHANCMNNPKQFCKELNV